MTRPDTAASLEALRRMPLFSTLAEADLRSLLGDCRTRRVAAGEQIFSPEDEAECFYVILQGKVKLYQLSPRGDEQILHLYGPGHTFGEAAMWAGINYPAHAEAVGATTLLGINRTELAAAVARDPELALQMIAAMSAKLREFNQLIEQLSLKEVPARLAAVLLRMSQEAGSDTIHLPQAKRELAAQIGTVAETLSRAFGKLRKAGLIEVNGAEITILDPDGLEELAES